MTSQEKRAATARRNYLLRVLAVQRLYQSKKVEGMPAAYVFRKFIGPEFCISLRTFREYLGTNAKRELKAMGVDPDETGATARGQKG